MQKILLLFFLLSGTICFSQDSWSAEQIELISKFGISKDDHRGVTIFIDDNQQCELKYKTIQDAVNGFLGSNVKKDIVTICILDNSNLTSISGRTLDLFQLTNLYFGINPEGTRYD